ncbi:uncharacterized protein LOC124417551 [Gallus gallus]|uniref:uncharacterized protein LOC124417551 n=1 Tax=Gallus gallus TaxID=9031 RepID=UPI001F00BCD6|nr:uncharacterized protein LOC124417551 [Gallus gallus]XP_046793258.1 uncharacterized protein LOC124417551 [Gallus gallus]
MLGGEAEAPLPPAPVREPSEHDGQRLCRSVGRCGGYAYIRPRGAGACAAAAAELSRVLKSFPNHPRPAPDAVPCRSLESFQHFSSSGGITEQLSLLLAEPRLGAESALSAAPAAARPQGAPAHRRRLCPVPELGGFGTPLCAAPRLEAAPRSRMESNRKSYRVRTEVPDENIDTGFWAQECECKYTLKDLYNFFHLLDKPLPKMKDWL